MNHQLKIRLAKFLAKDCAQTRKIGERMEILKDHRKLVIPQKILQDMLMDELIIWKNTQELSLTNVGRKWLKRALCSCESYRQQNGDWQKISYFDRETKKKTEIQIDLKESPLAWLYSRKDRNGKRMLSKEQFVAGEKLRHEFTYAQLMPSVTSNWSGYMTATKRQKGWFDKTNLSDRALTARKNVDNILSTIGPEFAGILIDICCLLKGIKIVEHERQWPARSGKVILQLALDRLVRYYDTQ